MKPYRFLFDQINFDESINETIIKKSFMLILERN